MGEMADDRIYADRRGKTDVYVGAGLGLTLVGVSDDRVGRFRLIRRGEVQSVTADRKSVVIGTDDDVFRATTDDPETFEGLGFGSAVAVGIDGPTAVSPDGEVARYEGDGTWQSLGTVEEPRAIAGEWLAAGDGMYRIDGGTLTRSGPSAADVAIGDHPIAAGEGGLYRFADGAWHRECEGTFDAVASDGNEAHAVGSAGLFERRDGEWLKRDPPTDERIVDLAYGQGIVAVTAIGTILVDPAAAKDGADGWRSRSLGLGSVTSLAVGPTRA
ncbi:MAG: hypothetical protein ABEI98_06585 [Halorhabdus sp.]